MSEKPYTEYPISDEEYAEVENKYSYHAPGPEQIEKHEAVRELLKQTEREIRRIVPPGRPRAVAITNLEQVGFWSNAGIARKESAKQQGDGSDNA